MTPPRRSIRINAWGVERLRQHPYVDFYQARKIVECRKKYGRITDLSRLEFYDEFTAEDLKRLEPYVDYR
jgi:DNA uptake protein ComE-like DNA-binding protein